MRWGYRCSSLECLSSTQLHPWPATSAMRQDTATTVWTTSTWSVRWAPSGPGRVWGSTAAWWSPPVRTCVSPDLGVSGSGTELLQTMWWEGGFWRKNSGEDNFGIKWQKRKVCWDNSYTYMTFNIYWLLLTRSWHINYCKFMTVFITHSRAANHCNGSYFDSALFLWILIVSTLQYERTDVNLNILNIIVCLFHDNWGLW